MNLHIKRKIFVTRHELNKKNTLTKHIVMLCYVSLHVLYVHYAKINLILFYLTRNLILLF
jgi:hypothetical protein